MVLKKVWSLLGAVVVAAMSLAITNVKAGSPTGVTDLAFKTYVQAGQPEQDVFVQSSSDTEQVFRLKPEDAQFRTNLDKRVFAAASAVAHDPHMTGTNPLGPFTRGADLGFTLESWLTAQGSGQYLLRDDGSAALHLSFRKLVPNAIYTILCSRMSSPPNPTADEKTCPALDGSESALKTDAAGNANFKLELKSPLAESSTGTVNAVMTVIALDYHSDGKTCAGSPCQFGLNSHVQLSAVVPDPSQLRREESRRACQARVLKEKNETLKVARTTYLDAQKAARLHNSDQIKAAQKARAEAIKAAGVNRRDAQAATRDARTLALQKARTDYLDAIRVATTEDQREIARENRAGAQDKAASDYDLGIDRSNESFHFFMNKAQTTWDADRNAAKSDLESALDTAKIIYDTTKSRGLADYHAERVGCLLNS
jgi:hypothetical protein